MTDLEEVTRGLDLALVETAKVRRDLIRENEKRDKRIRNGRFATVIALLVAVGAVAVGWRSDRDLSRANAANFEARIASCQQSNRSQRQEIAAADLRDGVLAKNLAPPPRSPEVQRRVDTFLTEAHAASVTGHPLRDCTPAGIRRYYADRSGS